MKAFITFDTNDVDSYLSKADVTIRRTKRSTFPKSFNIEVGDILVRNKLQAKVINVDRKNKEIVVIPWGMIRMTEQMFRGNFFDYSCCICKQPALVDYEKGKKIVFTERINTEFFTMERIISIEKQ